MKLIEEHDRTWELKPRDLGKPAVLGKLAREAKPGDYVYAPLPPPVAVIADRFIGDEPADPEDRPITKPSKPDPHRVDALRDALRSHGRGLHDCGAFYWQVVEAQP